MSHELVDTRFVPSLHGWRESLFTVANGVLSVRGSFPDPLEGAARATFVQGTFVTTPGELPRQTAVPDATGLAVSVDDQPVRLDRGDVLGFDRRLDLDTGTITRTIVWRGRDTATLRIRHRRVVPLSHRWHVGTDVDVTPLDRDATVTITADLDPRVDTPDRPAWERTSAEASPERLHLVARSVDERHRVAWVRDLRGDGDRGARDTGARVLATRTRHLEPGQHHEATAIAALRIRRDDGPWEGREEPLEDVDVDDLVAASRTAWARRWRDVAVSVPGDPEVEFALRYAAFQLVGAASRDDRASLAAKLLSGLGYAGHVFWDTDVFIAPWLSVAAPDLARHHLAYRHRTLPAARRRAAEYDRQGAFFAWESADTGEDVTPTEVETPSGGTVEIHTGRLQEHVVGDVAWSVDHHHQWTGDDEWAAGPGADLVVATAHYWAGRVEVDDHGVGHLRHVIGPDEYHTDVDDSLFNNAIAAHNLRLGVQWLERLDGDARRRVLDDAGVAPDAVDDWGPLADRLVLPRADDGVLLQYPGLHELPTLDLSRWSPMRGNLEKVIARGVEDWQVLKQADVVMALALLPEVAVDNADAAAAFDRYLPLCEHGSSLSLGTHAQVAARLGRTALAHELLVEAIAIDLDDSHGNGEKGLHAATLGGLLHAVLFGFAGLQPTPDGPLLDPHLPDHWEGLAFTVHHHGQRHDVEV